MVDDTRAQAPARGWRLVVLAGFVGFTLTFAASHFLLPIRLWASVSESTVTLFLSAVVATLTAAVAAPLLSRNLRLENQRMRGAINNMSQGSLHVRRQRAPGRLQSPLHANVQS